MSIYEVEGHVPSILPDKNWKLIWHDEFDGTELDTTKWDYRLHMMSRRCPHWTKDAISFDGNSNAVFHLLEKDGIYCTTQIQTGYNYMDMPREEYDTNSAENRGADKKEENYFSWPIGEIKEPKFMHKYGYYECRCKMQQKEGWWSAFWLQSPIIGSTTNPEFSGVEVDIMEQFYRTKYKPHNIIQHNNHWNGYGKQHKSTGSTIVQLHDTPDGYHIFGLEWTAEYYRYYVDGVMTHQVDGPISQCEQFILISTEAIGFRSSGWTAWDDLKDAVGDTFVVDYVRVFDEVK